MNKLGLFVIHSFRRRDIFRFSVTWSEFLVYGSCEPSLAEASTPTCRENKNLAILLLCIDLPQLTCLKPGSCAWSSFCFGEKWITRSFQAVWCCALSSTQAKLHNTFDGVEKYQESLILSQCSTEFSFRCSAEPTIVEPMQERIKTTTSWVQRGFHDSSDLHLKLESTYKYAI